MKRGLLIAMLIAIPLFACSMREDAMSEEGKNALTNNEIKFLETGLTLLSITTENHELPTCEYVSAPEGSMGRGIKNTTKVKGRSIHTGWEIVF